MPEITVPDHMSIEGRATMIAEESGRAEHAGSPDARRQHIARHAEAHIRAAVDQALRVYEARAAQEAK